MSYSFLNPHQHSGDFHCGFTTAQATLQSPKRKNSLFRALHDAAVTYQLIKINASSFMRFNKFLRQHLTLRRYLKKHPMGEGMLYSFNVPSVQWVICRQLFICKRNSIGYPQTVSIAFFDTVSKLGNTTWKGKGQVFVSVLYCHGGLSNLKQHSVGDYHIQAVLGQRTQWNRSVHNTQTTLEADTVKLLLTNVIRSIVLRLMC